MMERPEILEMMRALKLAGMRAARSRSHEAGPFAVQLHA